MKTKWCLYSGSSLASGKDRQSKGKLGLSEQEPGQRGGGRASPGLPISKRLAAGVHNERATYAPASHSPANSQQLHTCGSLAPST